MEFKGKPKGFYYGYLRVSLTLQQVYDQVPH